MKVYVDELPKSCRNCPCCNDCGDYGVSCNITKEFMNLDVFLKGKLKSCPLQSLSDYTKQVRKEVCDRVYNVLTTESVWIAFKKCWLNNGECKELRQLLDQIQGE